MMPFRFFIIATLISFCFIITVTQTYDIYEFEMRENGEGEAQVLLKLTEQGHELAKRIAAKHGMVVRRLPFLDSYYVFYPVFPISKLQKRAAINSLKDNLGVCGIDEERSFLRVEDAHDSPLCEQTGTCPEVSHIIMKLARRDDEMARRIAAEHGMVVKGQPFLDSYYFVEHAITSSNSQKRAAINSLRNHPYIEEVTEERPKIRVKRDYDVEAYAD